MPCHAIDERQPHVDVHRADLVRRTAVAGDVLHGLAAAPFCHYQDSVLDGLSSPRDVVVTARGSMSSITRRMATRCRRAEPFRPLP